MGPSRRPKNKRRIVSAEEKEWLEVVMEKLEEEEFRDDYYNPSLSNADQLIIEHMNKRFNRLEKLLKLGG